MVKSKFTFFQYFRRDQAWSDISQYKVNITIFLSQNLQRRPCSCKLNSRYVPPHCSLPQDNGVSLTSHNTERNSEGGCSFQIALSWFSVAGIAPVLLTQRFSSSQMLSIVFKSGDFGGKSKKFSLFAFRYVVVALARWARAIGKTSNVQWGKNLAISRISRAFFVLVAVIICSCTLFWNHEHVLSVRTPMGYSLDWAKSYPT